MQKMRKKLTRVLSFLMSICLVLTMLPVTALAEEEPRNFVEGTPSLEIVVYDADTTVTAPRGTVSYKSEGAEEWTDISQNDWGIVEEENAVKFTYAVSAVNADEVISIKAIAGQGAQLDQTRGLNVNPNDACTDPRIMNLTQDTGLGITVPNGPVVVTFGFENENGGNSGNNQARIKLDYVAHESKIGYTFQNMSDDLGEISYSSDDGIVVDGKYVAPAQGEGYTWTKLAVSDYQAGYQPNSDDDYIDSPTLRLPEGAKYIMIKPVADGLKDRRVCTEDRTDPENIKNIDLIPAEDAGENEYIYPIASEDIHIMDDNNQGPNPDTNPAEIQLDYILNENKEAYEFSSVVADVGKVYYSTTEGIIKDDTYVAPAGGESYLWTELTAENYKKATPREEPNGEICYEGPFLILPLEAKYIKIVPGETGMKDMVFQDEDEKNGIPRVNVNPADGAPEGDFIYAVRNNARIHIAKEETPGPGPGPNDDKNHDPLNYIAICDNVDNRFVPTEGIKSLCKRENEKLTFPDQVEGFSLSDDGRELVIDNVKDIPYLIINGGLDSHLAIKIKGEVEIGTIYIHDADIEVRPDGRGSDMNATSLTAGFIVGNKDGQISFKDDVVLHVGSTGNAPAFENIDYLHIENYQFHDRTKVNTEINAQTAFRNVNKLDILSSKVKVNATIPFEMPDEAMTEVTLFQEGNLEINKYTDGLGACEIKNHYYKGFPENGKATSEDWAYPDQPANGLADKYVATTGDLSKITQPDENTAAEEAYKLTVGKIEGTEYNSYHLECLDPILYAISYVVDPESQEGIYNEVKKENDAIKMEDIDTNGGTVIMEGFKKGYFIEKADGTFEAWIAAGEEVKMKIMPKPGYQYLKNSVNVNGYFFDTTAGEDIGEYTYIMGAYAGHLSAGFIKTENLVTSSAESIQKGTIEADINAEMTLADAKVEDAAKEEFAKAAPEVEFDSFIDIKVEERTVKNYDVTKSNAEQEAWKEPKAELDKPAAISIKLDPKKYEGEDFTLVREHNGKYEKIEAKFDKEKGMLTFESDKFSTYAISSGKKVEDGGEVIPKPEDFGSDDDFKIPGIEDKNRTSIKDAEITLKKNSGYTGAPVEPSVTVKILSDPSNSKSKKITLKPNKDYRVYYENNVKAGKATVHVVGINDYKDEVQNNTTFDIAPKKVSKLKVYIGTVMEDNGIYKDYSILVYDGTVKLKEGTDYKITSITKKKPTDKKAIATIEGLGNYSGTRDVKLTIVNAGSKTLLTADMISIADQTYKGESKVLPTISEKESDGNDVVVKVDTKDGTKILRNKKDFTISFSNNKSVGVAYATVKGKGDYVGTVVVPWNILKNSDKTLKSVEKDVVVNSGKAKNYNGSLQKPAVVVKNPYSLNKKLVKNKDYRIYYAKNLNAGTAEVIITGIGNYEGESIKASFTINPANISGVKYVIVDKKLAKITYNGKLLTEGKDYTHTYTYNEKHKKYEVEIDGTATMNADKIITGTGNFYTAIDKNGKKKSKIFKVADINYEVIGWKKDENGES